MEPQRVKVLFRIDRDEDGYPPVEVESLWGALRDEGVEIDNVPFYARGVALGDIVKVGRSKDGALEFESVLRRGGHSTYRLLLLREDPEEPLRVMSELVAMGLRVEQDVACLLAVDVPPAVSLDDVRDFLLEGIDSGRWEVEEAHRAEAT